MIKIFKLLLISVTGLFSSCEMKHNINGDFNGNWQMTSWICNSKDSIIASNKDGIYYAVNLDLLKMYKPLHTRKEYICTFKLTSDSLILTAAYVTPFDSVVSFSDLKEYGVSPNGRFRICRLNEKELILSNEESNLTFRKY